MSGPHERVRLGPYELRAKIAEGGMASIYLARGPKGVAAIKVIQDDLSSDKAFVDMFIDEARIVSRLSHPNVVRIFEWGSDPRLYLAMELLVGQSLWSVWEACRQRNVRMRYDLIAWIGARIADGLHHAHELVDEHGQPLSVVHRDVNAANVLVTYDGEVKVIDFGLAKAANRLSRTAAGVLKGKIAYMSPEQARGGRIDRRTDLFALGITLWELSADRRLFKGANDTDTMRAIVEARVSDPTQLVLGYPRPLWRVLRKALARDPAQRYATGAEMAADLDACARLEGRTVTNATAAEVVRALFAEQHKRQVAWIAEATGGVAPTDTLRPDAADMRDSPPLGHTEVPETLRGELAPAPKEVASEPSWRRPVLALLVLLAVGGLATFLWAVLQRH